MSVKWKSNSTMPKALKTRWVKALRSGKFKKIKSALEKVDEKEKYIGNCCLGVLCRVDKVKPGKIIYYNNTREFDNSSGFLSDTLLARFGLTDNDQRKLGELNDESCLGFTGIARWIEKNVATA